MASRLALSLVIGGAVASSVGAAFNTVEGRIKKLEDKGNKAKVLKSTIGETIKLRDEWKRAHDVGAAGADKLLRKLDGNLEALRKQGVEVGRLGREYQRLGREAKAADLQMKGHQQLQAGKSSLKSNIGQSVVATGMAAVPTMISANYQAVIRDIAIKADVVNKTEERQLTRTVIDTSQETGMSRNDVADLVNQLVGAGMELNKALSYAPTAAKFAIGQGASGVDTASMIMALQQNAKINDPKVMQQALEAIAYQGQAGSFEASDMAKWFPQLLAGMEKNGITGMESVTSLGAMLQVQMKTAGSSDEAANNFKNWMEKIGSGDVVKAYNDVGIDYQASLNTGLQKGMSVIESSMALAMKYVQATDPAKAKKIKDAQAGIDKEVDPEKAKAALEALEKTLRTGDLFADMQVKAALTAYAQNRGLYNELKADSQKASGILDKNLAERRETSAQQWAELGQAVDDSMRSIGDAIRPATDLAAKGLTKLARGITSLSDNFQPVVLGIAGITAAVLAFKTASSALKIGRGVYNIARGRGLEHLAGRAGRADRAPIELPKTGNKVVDTGLSVLGKVFSARTTEAVPADDPEAGGNVLQRVFVVNANAFAGVGSGVANSAPAGAARGSRRSRRRERRRAAKQGPVAQPAAKVDAPAAPPAKRRMFKAVPAALTGGDELGKVARSMRGVTRLAKRLPGGNFMDAGTAALDVALNAKTQDEKAEGYGAAGGSLAGTLAGAAAGAAIGSVVPVIGTAVGGAVGAVLGGMGGESVGAWLGKHWFGDEQPEGEAKPLTETPSLPGEALRVTLEPGQEAKSAPMPALGLTVREPVKAVAPAPTVVKPVIPPSKPEPVLQAPVAVPAAVDSRERVPVAEPVPVALGQTVREPVKAVAPAPTVVKPVIKPAKPEPEPQAPVAVPAAVDSRERVSVAEPMQAPVPALGQTVREPVKAVAPAPTVVKPVITPAKPEPVPRAPVVVLAAVDNRERVPVAEPMPAAVPALGQTLREPVKAVAPAPTVVKPVITPAKPEPVAQAPVVVPAAVDNRERVVVAEPVPAAVPALGQTVREPVKAVAPAPTVVKPVIKPAKPEPVPQAPVALPEAVDSRERVPVAQPVPAPVPALGQTVREPVKAVAPAPTVVKPVITPAKPEPVPQAPVAVPVAADNREREPVAEPMSAPVPALGQTMREPVKAVAPASTVVKPVITPAAPESVPRAPVVVLAAVDNRERVPVAEPVSAPAPALGQTVREPFKAIAPAPTVVKPVIMPAAPEPEPQVPVVPAAGDNPERVPVVEPMPTPVVALGQTVREPVKTVAPVPTVVQPVITPAAPEPVPQAPLAVPAAADNRERVPVAEPMPAPPLGTAMRDLVKAMPAAPAPVLVKPLVMLAQQPAALVPLVPPVVVDNRERQPVVERVSPDTRPTAPVPAGPPSFGEVVREMAKSAPSVPRLPEQAKPAKAPEPAKLPAPKVEQSFTFAPVIKLDVHGDVKDPEQVVRELESPLRRLFEAFQRDVSARMSSAQLFDQPHI
ncbi:MULTISPECIES: phage tail tape measure protein [unclassified Pseudomonas]|uniref:phage tail tape measure protein n=1 Tax=unclassified Pseudomonas TaxID=196821 RepID=UPI001930EB8B